MTSTSKKTKIDLGEVWGAQDINDLLVITNHYGDQVKAAITKVIFKGPDYMIPSTLTQKRQLAVLARFKKSLTQLRNLMMKGL